MAAFFYFRPKTAFAHRSNVRSSSERPWYVLTESAKKARLNSSQIQNIFEIPFKNASTEPPVEYLENRNFLTGLDRSLEYTQVQSLSFLGLVNIEVTVGRQLWKF